jgi:two-component system chemotaxis response regulator CheY
MNKVQKTVLVVDDSMFMRRYLKSILSDNNYKVLAESSNGKDAISLYREVKPAIVLLDFTLPDINGVSVLKEIKKIDPFAKVVMCSAMGQKSLLIEALQHGARDFIVKPNFQQLIPTLNHILEL